MIDFRGKKILCVFAHPDDEVLACGGLLHAVKDIAAISFCWLAWNEDMREEMRTAMDYLGMGRANAHTFDSIAPDNEMDAVTQLTINKKVELVVEAETPDIIFTHHYDDLNVDHQMTHNAVVCAARPLGRPISIIMCEVLSSSGYRKPWRFDPNFYYRLTEYNLLQKLQAMAAYTSQARPFPHPRSAQIIKARARYHGAMSGTAAAEAFQILRAHA